MNVEALIAVAATFVVVLAWTEIAKWRVRRRFTRVPLVPLGGTPKVDGRVIRVMGTVRGAEPLVKSPYTGRDGVVAIAERWEQSWNKKRERLVDRSVRETAFYVDDAAGSARVIVGAIDYVIDLVPVAIATSGPQRVFGAGIIASNATNQRVRELVIAPGDHVTCLGVLRRGSDGGVELVASAVTRQPR